MREALFYEKAENSAVLCRLCPRGCRIADGSRGACRVRVNHGGALYAESYGRITSLALDPIEKKPLARFYPGSMILSLGSYGCSFHCPFCQNHSISMGSPDWEEKTPEDLAALSLLLAERGNIGLAYTYNEPLIGIEFVSDCARLMRAQGQKNVLVTNGYIRPEPLAALLPLIDAMNIDLKTFNPLFYRTLGGDLDAVKATIAAAFDACHVEVTTLVIPGKNDSQEEMDTLAAWIASLSPEIPLHITRFFPRFQMTDRPPTPVSTIKALTKTAKRHLKHVYTGNL